MHSFHKKHLGVGGNQGLFDWCLLEEQHCRAQAVHEVFGVRMWWALLTDASWKDKRQWTKTELQEIPYKHKKSCFYCEDVSALEQVAQRVCEVSVLRDIQNPSGHSPQQPALDDHALVNRRWSSQVPPSSSILWFSDWSFQFKKRLIWELLGSRNKNKGFSTIL